MTSIRKTGIMTLMLWTIIVTVLRAFRTPNDFAEAHWLLDYRFGFVKRGLVGEILSLVTGTISIPITEQLISVLSTLAFLIYCSAIFILAVRLLGKAGWTNETVLVSIVFLSSPFIVMSAHLNGYYDNIIIMIGILSFVLLFRGKLWLAVILQVLAIFIHESSILLMFPLFCFIWLLMNSKRQQSGMPDLPLLPLCLPIIAFIIMAVSQSIFVSQDFIGLFTARLSQFSFIQENRSTLVPVWISTSFFDYFASQKSEFLARLTWPRMHMLILLSALAIIGYTMNAFRILDLSVESICLVAVCFAPQIMHLVAWDTPRIWTYTVLCAFLMLWIYSELFVPKQSTSVNRLLSFVALVANAFILTPLMDSQNDHFNAQTRLLLYLPVILGGLILMLDSGIISIADRLSIQGNSVFKFIHPAKLRRLAPGVARSDEPDAPEH